MGVEIFTVWNSTLSGSMWRNCKMIFEFDLRTFHVIGGGKASSTWEVLVNL